MVDKKVEKGSSQKVAPRAGYRRQVVWLVYVPLALGVLAVLALGLWVLMGSIGDSSVWADVSLVILAGPVLLLGLVQLALAVALVVGLTKALQAIPAPMRQADLALWRLKRAVRRGSDLAAKPLIAPRAAAAALRHGLLWLGSILAPPAPPRTALGDGSDVQSTQEEG